MKQCPACSRWLRSYTRICACGHVFEAPAEESGGTKGSVILVLCTVLAGLQAMVSFGFGVIQLVEKKSLLGTLLCLASMVYSLGMLIVFNEVNEWIASREQDKRKTR